MSVYHTSVSFQRSVTRQLMPEWKVSVEVKGTNSLMNVSPFLLIKQWGRQRQSGSEKEGKWCTWSNQHDMWGYTHINGMNGGKGWPESSCFLSQCTSPCHLISLLAHQEDECVSSDFLLLILWWNGFERVSSPIYNNRATSVFVKGYIFFLSLRLINKACSKAITRFCINFRECRKIIVF